jgi:hypothetical protein
MSAAPQASLSPRRPRWESAKGKLITPLDNWKVAMQEPTAFDERLTKSETSKHIDVPKAKSHIRICELPPHFVFASCPRTRTTFAGRDLGR